MLSFIHGDVTALCSPAGRVGGRFEQFWASEGPHRTQAKEMFEAVNAGWMDLGVEGAEHVAGTTSARDVFEAALNAVKRKFGDSDQA